MLLDQFGTILDSFDKLLIVKISKPFMILNYQKSDNQTRIIFVLSNGEDLSSIVKNLREEKGF